MDYDHLMSVVNEYPFLRVLEGDSREAADNLEALVAQAQVEIERSKEEIKADLAAHKGLSGEVEAAVNAKDKARLKELAGMLKGLSQRIEGRRFRLKALSDGVVRAQPLLGRLQGDVLAACAIVYPETRIAQSDAVLQAARGRMAARQQDSQVGAGPSQGTAPAAQGSARGGMGAGVAMTAAPIVSASPVKRDDHVADQARNQTEAAGQSEHVSGGEEEPDISVLLADIAASSKAVEAGLTQSLELLGRIDQRFSEIDVQLSELKQGLNELASQRDAMMRVARESEEKAKALNQSLSAGAKKPGLRDRAAAVAGMAREWLEDKFAGVIGKGEDVVEQFPRFATEAGRMHGPSFNENFDRNFAEADVASMARRFVKNPQQRAESNMVEELQDMER